MMNKRGISPLIATVLIIGFTVALAALVIVWGGRFITDTQDDVDETVELSSSNAEIRLLDAKVVSQTITIENRGKVPITHFKVRGNGLLETVDISNSPLNSFEIESYIITDGNIFLGTIVEVIPGITVRGNTEYLAHEIVDIIPGGCVVDLDCDDLSVCTGVETCVDSVCIAGIPLLCDDANVCNGAETCDPSLGCQAGTPLVCDDANVCNGAETCDPSLGCQPGSIASLGTSCAGGECDDTGICDTNTEYKAFVTSGVYDGNLGGLSGADAICKGLADAVPAIAGKNWKAWLSSSVTSAGARLYHSPHRYVDAVGVGIQDDTGIVDDWDDLIDVPFVIINKNENNVGVTVDVFTGTDDDGTSLPGTSGEGYCDSWTSTVGNAQIGSSSDWTSFGPASCAVTRRLYCFEQP